MLRISASKPGVLNGEDKRTNKPSTTRNVKGPFLPVLSLFCGAGGLDLGFEQAGFSPLLALDADLMAVTTYNWNRGGKAGPAKVADLAALSPKKIAQWWEEVGGGTAPVGVIGGPPCQAFSMGNVHPQEDDPRASLPLPFARILGAVNKQFPVDFFLFENVLGLGRDPHRRMLDQLLKAFDTAGFSAQMFQLDAVKFGVPQYRERLFVVGFNKARRPNVRFDIPEGEGVESTVEEAIGGLPEPVHWSARANPPREGLHRNHWCMNPRSSKFTDGSLKAGDSTSRSFRRLAPGKPSWTVAYGNREAHIHPKGHRRLSVYEAMLLQGFPDDYEVIGTQMDQFRFVCDAVPPPLARALADAIARTLGYYSARGRPKAHHVESGQAGQLGLPGVQTVAPRSTRA